jgi:hypothetical protein
MVTCREEGLSQGLKPNSRLFFNVWAEAQTYLRDNSNDSQGQQQRQKQRPLQAKAIAAGRYS